MKTQEEGGHPQLRREVGSDPPPPGARSANDSLTSDLLPPELGDSSTRSVTLRHGCPSRPIQVLSDYLLCFSL